MRKILYRLIDLFPVDDILYMVYKYLLLLDDKNPLPLDKSQFYELYQRLINLPGLSEIDLRLINMIGKKYGLFTIPDNVDLLPSFKKMAALYDQIKENKEKRTLAPIIITMTTCKRFNLFERTVNSLLNTVTDLVNYVTDWIVVDDNSSEEDKNKMRALYPFITLIEKTPAQKGHAQSMNIIIEEVKKRKYCQYVFHLEDDWLFVKKGDILSTCLEVLTANEKFGQCLINQRYAEDFETGLDIGGGFLKTIFSANRGSEVQDLNFYIHEYYAGDSLQEQVKILSSAGLSNNMYWPHYSLRPGLMKVSVFEKLGEYNPAAPHFEREYAYRYVAAGFLTTYLQGVNSLHIGRKTYERGDQTKQNAYDLNNELQFVEKNDKKEEKSAEIFLDAVSLKAKDNKTIDLNNPADLEKVLKSTTVIKSYVLNLKRRPDRWDSFLQVARDENFTTFHRFNAIDGALLRPNLMIQKLFSTGDFNYRHGIVGCALSHVAMYQELDSSSLNVMSIMEDDARLAKNFKVKLLEVLSQAPPDFDIIFLGHHLYPQFKTEKDEEDSNPKIEEWYRDRCIKESMGGTTGYIISKAGARKMLAHIKKYGIYNAIDWVIFKTARVGANDTDINNCKIFYTYPHIVYAPCVQSSDQPVDSDIQNVYQPVKLENWYEEATKYFGKFGNIILADTLPSNREFLTNIIAFRNKDLIKLIPKNIPILTYSFEETVITIGEKLVTEEMRKEIPFNGFL